MKTPVNGKTLRQHLTYAWWKYALVIIVGTLGVNLLYTVTAYRSPAEKKVDLYVYGVADQTLLSAYMDEVRLTKMPDMEEMSALLMTTDASYGPMQISTYVAAGEGDIYILPRDEFVSLASGGAWVPLENNSGITSIFTERDISLQSGWRREAETGESHLYGIPLSKLPGLSRYLYVENGFVSVLLTNGNDDNVLKFLSILCEDMVDDVPVEGTAEGSEVGASGNQTDSQTGMEDTLTGQTEEPAKGE